MIPEKSNGGLSKNTSSHISDYFGCGVKRTLL